MISLDYSPTPTLDKVQRRSGLDYYPCDAMLARVLAMALCLSVCLSVCHKSVFYWSGWRDRAGFWQGGFFRSVLHCVARSCSGGVAIRYVLPVLWTTSRFHTWPGLGHAKKGVYSKLLSRGQRGFDSAAALEREESVATPVALLCAVWGERAVAGGEGRKKPFMTNEGESECDSLLSERAKSSFALFTPLRSVLLSPHPPQKKSRGAHHTFWPRAPRTLQGGPTKRGRRLMTIVLSNLIPFQYCFHWKIPW